MQGQTPHIIQYSSYSFPFTLQSWSSLCRSNEKITDWIGCFHIYKTTYLMVGDKALGTNSWGFKEVVWVMIMVELEES